MLQFTRRQLAALRGEIPTAFRKPRPVRGRLPRLEPLTSSDAAEFNLVISLQPRPKQRARHSAKSGFVRTYTPAETWVFEATIREACAVEMARTGLEPLIGPLQVEFEFGLEGDPLYWPTAQKDGDLDNIEKAAMNKTVFRDDRFIVRKTGTKVCSPEPYISIRIRPGSNEERAPLRGPARRLH